MQHQQQKEKQQINISGVYPFQQQNKSDGLNNPIYSSKTSNLSINNDKFIQQKSEKFEDQYSVVSRLGSGVYGDVFKIKHKSLGLFRALKVIKRDETKKYSQKLQIDVLKSMDHPSILKIYEFYELPNFYYIVTELFDGNQLYNQILKNGLFSEQKAAETAYQVLKALVYTHGRKIAHRDIKLENILIKSVNNTITIKLIDWGFGSFVKSKLMRMCGTPEYAAPDIFKGQYDQKCDIWSFGVLVYILLSATFPFRGETKQQTVSLISKGKFSFQNPIWSRISSQAKQFISNLLITDPSKRLSAQQAINSKWITSHLKKQYDFLDVKDTLNSFKEVMIKNNMATAAVSYISNYLSTQQQKQKLNQVFHILDSNGDGTLSFNEISKAYQSVYGPSVGKAVAEQTFTKLDLNHNGVLQYHQFITYSLDLKKMLSGAKLKAAFDLFDSNHDGKINLTQLKQIFQYDLKMFDQHKFKNWLDELDSNGDGLIDENEFIKKLIQICNIVQQSKSLELDLIPTHVLDSLKNEKQIQGLQKIEEDKKKQQLKQTKIIKDSKQQASSSKKNKKQKISQMSKKKSVVQDNQQQKGQQKRVLRSTRIRRSNL